MEEETRKLLGTLNNGSVRPAAFAMSAQCNRVAVEGQLESQHAALTTTNRYGIAVPILDERHSEKPDPTWVARAR